MGRTIKTEIAVNNCANKPNKTALKTCFFVMPEIFSAGPIIIAQLISIAPIKTYFVITSLNKINAKNITVGAYAVAIIAEIPDPTILKLFRKSRSPIATPIIPLNKSVIISKKEKSKKFISKINIVKIKPMTPMKFFIRLICILLNNLPERSNKITAEDQHNAVKIANRSPKFMFI